MKISHTFAPGQGAVRRVAAFTMVEIAICLAIIGFALVAIIGVLPVGMNVQKANREETIINFDANYLLGLLRSGAQDTNSFGTASLTNYLIAITNVSTGFNSNGVPLGGQPTLSWFIPTGYQSWVNGNEFTGTTNFLINDANVIGILSTPKYVFQVGTKGNFISNSMVADFRAITGSVMDQGSTSASHDFAFTYRVTIEIVQSATFPYAYNDTNSENFSAPGQAVIDPTPADAAAITAAWQFAKNQQNNLNEIRLTYRWPILPNGLTGPNIRVYRTSIAGTLATTNNTRVLPVRLYYISPLSYSSVN